MRKDSGVSRYKLFRIAVESLRNSLRLHFDSTLLFDNGSYASAFQLSVIALEEFAKAKWVEHYIWTSETNDGYPEEKFEQEWLQLLYSHPEKQFAAIGRDIFDYSPKFADFVRKKQLEVKKQRATYVGLSRAKGRVDPSSRVSTPDRIKDRDARQMISLLNDEFLYTCERIDQDEFHFDITAMDNVFDHIIYLRLLRWPHRSGLKSRKWSKQWFAK